MRPAERDRVARLQEGIAALVDALAPAGGEGEEGRVDQERQHCLIVVRRIVLRALSMMDVDDFVWEGGPLCQVTEPSPLEDPE